MTSNLLSLENLNKTELLNIIDITHKLKIGGDTENGILSGKTLILIFQKPSTRTRASFELAMKHLGGCVLYLGWQEAQLGRGETISDTSRVLGRYADCIVARVYLQSEVEEISRYAKVPVINALSNEYHPTQAITDIYTLWEKKKELEGLKIAYIGDGNNVCNSLLIGCSKVGINIDVASPSGYSPLSKALTIARKNAKRAGSTVNMYTDPLKAAMDADVVYTDTFVSMGCEEEKTERERVFLPKYQITSRIFDYTADDAVFMHCLPAHRGDEVVDEVIDGPKSIVWDQAENKLHVAKAILTYLLG